jgi:cardiolipin synthase
MLFSLPNALTIARIGAIPFVVACFYWDSPWASVAKVTLFLVACVTDFFDGYLARRQAKISEFGRIFDPVADKLLVSSILLMLAGTHVLSGLTLIPAAIILCREVLVSGLREFFSRHVGLLPVTSCAKWKTLFQMASISTLLVAHALSDWAMLAIFGRISLWIAAGLTLVTGAQYLRKAFPFIRQ